MGIVNNLKFKKAHEDGPDIKVLAQEIEDAYLEGRKSGWKQKKTFSPSTVGYGHGNCARYWFIAFNGAEFNETFTAQGIANMDNGTAAHERLEKILKKTGRLLWSEVEVEYDNPPIFGRMDFGLDWNGEEVIVEHKTAKMETWAIRQSAMAPAGYQLIQLLTYMKIKKLRHGIISYENKNDQQLLLIPITVNDRYIKIIDELFEWLREVYKAYQEDTLPNRAFTKSKPACKYCPVFEACWRGDYADKEVAVTIREYIPPK